MTGADADQVLAAAQNLLAAFGANRRDEYFACFAEGATFIFYTTSNVLGSRAAFEAEWNRWVREDGFAVLDCTSREQTVQMVGDDAAIFTHSVSTRARSQGEARTSDERETIVFRREEDGRWLAIHEHLSPTP